MALGNLTLSVTQGALRRQFAAKINGLTTGRVEVLNDGTPGFSVVNGLVRHSGLPYEVNTVVLREYNPGVGQGYLDSRIDITAANAPTVTVNSDGTTAVTGGVGAPTAQATTATASGPVYTYQRLLGSASTIALVAGSNSNLTLNTTSGVISATAAIGAGVSQTATVRESLSGIAVEVPITITGATPTPTPGPTPTPTPGALTPFAFDAATTPAITAYTATGTPLTTPVARQFDRMVRRLKAYNEGSGTLWDAIQLLTGLPMATEAQMQINIKSPGTGDLVKVGSPTFAPFDGASTAAANNAYDSSLTLADINRDNHRFMTFVRKASTTAALDAGALDTGGTNGVTINNSGSSWGMRAYGAGVTVSNTSSPYGGLGWKGYGRSTSTSVNAGANGIRHQTVTSTSQTLTSPATQKLRYLGATGSTSVPDRTLGGMVLFNRDLSVGEQAAFHAITTTFIDALTYGCPYIEERGVGAATINAQVIVYGLTPGALAAAYEAKRLGKTVALVGDFHDYNIDDIGGMLAAGLGWVDCKDFAGPSGFFREVAKWANLDFYARADTSDQTGLSLEGRVWNYGLRRLFDTTRTTRALAGLDVPIYMTGGVVSATKSGGGVTGITTRDGRTFTGSQFVFGDMEGEGVFLTGEPYVIGSEAAGSGIEGSNGYRPQIGALSLFNHAGTTNVRVDPYVTPGTPASGLLPDTVDLNSVGIVQGAPDPVSQSMNKRLMMSSQKARAVRWDYVFRNGAPRNYNALRYEALARQCALVTSQTSGAQAVDLQDLISNGTPVGPAGVWDWNASGGGFSTDLPMNAYRYGQAGMDAAARQAQIDDWDDYLLGMFYFILYSGDSRIPASLVTALQGYGFDAMHYLDPATPGRYFLQDRIYVRDPIWQLSGSFKMTGADITAGQAGLRSTKIVGYSAYRYDQHDKRRVAYDDGSGMALWRQGVVGGSNASLSIPVEAIQSVTTNAQFIYAASFSKVFQSNARMEFTITGIGQSSGVYASLAIDGGVSVQNVIYPTARTTTLAAPYSTPLYIPQS